MSKDSEASLKGLHWPDMEQFDIKTNESNMNKIGIYEFILKEVRKGIFSL